MIEPVQYTTFKSLLTKLFYKMHLFIATDSNDKIKGRQIVDGINHCPMRGKSSDPFNPFTGGSKGGFKVSDMKHMSFIIKGASYIREVIKAKGCDYKALKESEHHDFWTDTITVGSKLDLSDPSTYKYLRSIGGLQSRFDVTDYVVKNGYLDILIYLDEIFPLVPGNEFGKNNIFYRVMDVATHGHVNIAKYYISKGIMTAQDFTSYIKAISYSGKGYELAKYIESLDPNFRISLQKHSLLLYYALFNNEYDLIKFYVELGAPLKFFINSSKCKIWTALGAVATSGSIKLTKYLLSVGADPNTHGEGIIIAASRGHLHLVKFYVKTFPKTDPFNKSHTVRAAIKNGNMNMIRYLYELGWFDELTGYNMERSVKRILKNSHVNTFSYLLNQNPKSEVISIMIGCLVQDLMDCDLAKIKRFINSKNISKLDTEQLISEANSHSDPKVRSYIWNLTKNRILNHH